MAKTGFLHFVVLAGSLACSFALLGQWPGFKEPGAPRLANGDVDVNGPAPKSADGKPDFTGVWASAKGGPGGAKGKDKGPPPEGNGKEKGPPPDGKGKGKGKGPPPELAGGGVPVGGFQNMGVNMPGGLLPYQDAALALRNERLANNSKDHPDAHCLPLNPVQLWFHPQPRKLIQTAREIVMIAESNGGLRQIFTDGRALPAPDAQPWWFGYSVGKWDGDTLIVESNGFLDNAWIDENGSPMSNEARVTERIRRPSYGTLEVQITVNDPKTYKVPWTVTANQRLLADDELIEFICGENNTSVQHLVGK